MGFLLPAGLALAALAIPIVALYFLKLRRDEKTVSSLYLWRTLVRDTAANAPWQRLRPSWLLFLQLLALALLVLGVARPFSIRPAAPGDHLILVLDTSASMGATDEQPTRLAAALREAITPGFRAGSVLARYPDHRRLGHPCAPIGRHGPGCDRRCAGWGARCRGRSDLSAALNLASAVAARERDPEIVLLSDGKATLPERTSLPARVRYVPFGCRRPATARCWRYRSAPRRPGRRTPPSCRRSTTGRPLSSGA